MKCVVISDDNQYLTPRRYTGRGYQSRSGWSHDIEDAKIFNSKTAATNSANQCADKRPFIVFKIEYVVGGPA
jgi:hypothetical protein